MANELSIDAKAFLTSDECLKYLVDVGIDDAGKRENLTVFLITARSTSTLRHAYDYLNKTLPTLGIDQANIRLLEQRDQAVAVEQMQNLHKELKESSSHKKVILGKGFHSLFPNLLTVQGGSYNAMVVLRELWPKDEMQAFFLMVGKQGFAPGMCGWYIDLESSARDFTTEEYHKLKTLIEQNRQDDVEKMMMSIAETMMR